MDNSEEIVTKFCIAGKAFYNTQNFKTISPKNQLLTFSFYERKKEKGVILNLQGGEIDAPQIDIVIAQNDLAKLLAVITAGELVNETNTLKELQIQYKDLQDRANRLSWSLYLILTNGLTIILVLITKMFYDSIIK